MKLYTNSGDGGYTTMSDGKIISKADKVLCLMGELDEFSASLGVARANCENERLKKDIELIQRRISNVMAEIAGCGEIDAEEFCAEAERMIDAYDAKFCAFVLFGENAGSAYLNFARCVIRRAERTAAALDGENKPRNEVMAYLNRLSDLVYAMSLYSEK